MRAADEAHEIDPAIIEAVMAAKNCAVENMIIDDIVIRRFLR